MNVIADEGEIVTCENGHPLYRITRDILRKTILRADQFEAIHDNLDDPLPMTSIKMECPDCGKPWMKRERNIFGFGGSFKVHFENGWRP